LVESHGLETSAWRYSVIASLGTKTASPASTQRRAIG
jgi:hypothetical protein